VSGGGVSHDLVDGEEERGKGRTQTYKRGRWKLNVAQKKRKCCWGTRRKKLTGAHTKRGGKGEVNLLVKEGNYRRRRKKNTRTSATIGGTKTGGSRSDFSGIHMGRGKKIRSKKGGRRKVKDGRDPLPWGELIVDWGTQGNEAEGKRRLLSLP